MREDWAKQVERWKDSGLTAAEFAAETGINAHSLSWWQWKLSAAARTREKAPTPAAMAEPTSDDELVIGRRKSRRRRRQRSKPVAAQAMTFVELTPSSRSEPLEVVLASGRHIRIPIGFDAPTFERLLGILERPT